MQSSANQGKKQQEKEGEPRTVPPSNDEATARLLKTSAAEEPRDGTADENLTRRRLLRHDLLLVAFSSEATKREKRQRLLLTQAGRRSVSDFSSPRRG
ncbi:hypothetical protein B296_00036783, partial [Ensete ventricosum]